MVVRLPSLVLLLGLLTVSALAGEFRASRAKEAGRPQRQSCLACHPVHYRERGGCIGCHRGNPGSERKNVAHHFLIVGKYAGFTLGKTEQVREGARLMELLACRRCHVSGGRGNRLATSLDNLLDSKPVEEIAAAITSPAQGMPQFRLDEARVVPIVNAIFAGTPRPGKARKDVPYTVHFETPEREAGAIFTRKCGACHRMLTERHGLLGAGETGPNLSGLLSEFYPADFEGNKRWTRQRLLRWIENPRQVTLKAVMPPVPLDAQERRELAVMLGETKVSSCRVSPAKTIR